MEEMKDVGKRETMLFAQREIQPAVGGRGLQLKVEGAAAC